VNDTSSKPNFIDAWLEAQQGWLGRWQATAMERRVDATRVGMETLRKQFDPANPSAEMMNVVQGFQSLLHACTAQMGQSSSANDNASNSPVAQLMQAFPLGYAREQQLEWQTYITALAEYQQCALRLMQHFADVFTQSLQQVAAEAESRTQAGQSIQTVRELYDAWIECGEKCFAEVSRTEEFVAAQAAHTNALSRLRLAQRALMERWLQQYDLPTRSEINSLHQKMRGMSDRIAELEAQLVVKPSTTGRKKSP